MYKIILVTVLILILSGCMKEDSDSKESTSAERMSTPSIDNGRYKMSSVTMRVVYKNSGNFYGNYSLQVNHDSSVNPGYLGYEMSWQGNGIYRITIFGKATLTSTDLQSETIDCSSKTTIGDVVFDSNGNAIDGIVIQSGCGGNTNTLTTVSDTFNSFSGGMTRYVVAEDSSYQYQITYTFLKQNSSSRAFELNNNAEASEFYYVKEISAQDITRITTSFLLF